MDLAERMRLSEVYQQVYSKPHSVGEIMVDSFRRLSPEGKAKWLEAHGYSEDKKYN